MGFEPTTSCLGSKHSTPELRPLGASDCTILEAKYSQMLVNWDLSTLTRNGVAPLCLEKRPCSVSTASLQRIAQGQWPFLVL